MFEKIRFDVIFVRIGEKFEASNAYPKVNFIDNNLLLNVFFGTIIKDCLIRCAYII